MRIMCALTIYVSLSVVLPGTAAEAVDSTGWNGSFEAGRDAQRQQHYAEALRQYQASWALAEADVDRGAIAMALGETNRHLGKLKESAAWYERGRIAWRAAGNTSMLTASSLNLADIDRNLGDYSASETVLREALAFPVPPGNDRAMLRNALGDLLREQGRSSDARLLFEQNVSEDGVQGNIRATALIGLADLDRQFGNWTSGIDRWNEALTLSRNTGASVSEAIALRGLALTYLDSGSPARAEPLLRKALRVMENTRCIPPEQIATVHAALAQLYRSGEKLALAEDEWQTALQLTRRSLGESHPQVAWIMEMLSEVFSARGDFELARDYADRAAGTMSDSFGETSLPLAAALTNRALVEERDRRFDRAATDYQRAIAIAKSHTDGAPLHAAMLERYAGLLRKLRRTREAKIAAFEANSFRKNERYKQY